LYVSNKCFQNYTTTTTTTTTNNNNNNNNNTLAFTIASNN